jgi:hypothetical protein
MNRLKSLWKSMTDASSSGAPGSVETQHNFTPRAQQVMALARKEADRFHHNFVGTEHLLLGLISLGQGVAVNVLQKMGLELETVRLEVEKQVGTGPDQKVFGNIPYTPRVKKVLLLAAKEANALNHTYVGTEHILLGLLGDGEGVAALVLKSFEVDISKTRQEILRELDPNFQGAAPGTETAPSHPAPIPAKDVMPQREAIDTTKRYDVYCTERSDEVVVYRNALFKGRKGLFSGSQYDMLSDFFELEQADGQTVLVAGRSVIKFCEHGTTPGSEAVSGQKP